MQVLWFMRSIFQLLSSIRTSSNHNTNFDALLTNYLFSKMNPCRERCLLEALWFSRSNLGLEKIPSLFWLFAKTFFMITEKFLKILHLLFLLEKSLLGLCGMKYEMNTRMGAAERNNIISSFRTSTRVQLDVKGRIFLEFGKVQ